MRVPVCAVAKIRSDVSTAMIDIKWVESEINLPVEIEICDRGNNAHESDFQIT